MDVMGVQESPSGKILVSFGDLERGVCSSIGHPDRGFESLKWLGSCLGERIR